MSDVSRDYQRDVAAVMALARAEALARPPFHLVSHSMGGAIGLRALHDGLPVRAAVFSAPMWGIRMHPALRPLAWALATLLRAGRDGQPACALRPMRRAMSRPPPSPATC